MKLNFRVEKPVPPVSLLDQLKAITPKVTGVITTVSVKDGVSTTDFEVIASDTLTDDEQSKIKQVLGVV
jgi:hypothetical protein